MNILSLIIVTLLAGLLLFTMIAVTLAILANLKNGQSFRQNLAEQLHRLRLEKMLTALGIDTRRYLAKVPVTVIDRQMRTCASCPPPARERCDEALGRGEIEDPSFCPNAPELERIRKEASEPGHAA